MMYTAQVIGLGKIGLLYDIDEKREGIHSHVGACTFHPQIRLIGACDTQQAREEKLHTLAPTTPFYHDVDDMLHDHVGDIISICTPPETHYSLLQKIIPYEPKIIFCEKPIVVSKEEMVRLKKITPSCHIVPNLSRRWHQGIQEVRKQLKDGSFGRILYVSIQYTRGIFNTGAHFIDLIRFLIGEVTAVQVYDKVETSSDAENESSFSFIFDTSIGVKGTATAFNDKYYYLFEMDIYTEGGKITIGKSGDEISYYTVGNHSSFKGHRSLILQSLENQFLKQSQLSQAMNHFVSVLNGKEPLACTLKDGLIPYYVALHILQSYEKNGERVVVKKWRR